MTITSALLGLAVLGAAPQDTARVRDTVFLDEMVISGTRAAATPKLEQVAAVSVMTPTLAQRGPGLLASDLLRDVEGVHVQQTSAGQGSVVLRGLVGNQVMMLVNGVPMNNGTYRDGPGQYLATIDPETIERIEVVRGPASVLYGSDAQGGVINLITRTHRATGRPSARLAVGTSSADRGIRGRFSAGTSGNRWSAAVGGTVVSAGDLRAGGGLGAQEPTGFEAEGIDADVVLHLSETRSFEAAVQHFRMRDVPRYDRYVAFRAPAPGPDAEHVFSPQARQLVYGRYAFAPESAGLNRLEVTASLAVQREGRHRTKLADSVPADVTTHWRDDVYTPGLSLVGTSLAMLGPHAVMLTWGGEAYADYLRSEGSDENRVTGTVIPLERASAEGPVPTGNFPDGATMERAGVFLSGEAHLSSLFRVSGGLRWSVFRTAANVGSAFGGAVENSSADLTGQVGLVIAPASRWRVALRLAEGFRAPNLYDLTRVGPVPGGIALPNPDAEAEHSVTGDLALRYATGSTVFDLTFYATRIRGFFDRVPGTFQGDTLFDGERVFQGRNVGTARLRGFEWEGAQAVGPVRLRATALYTYGEQEPAAGGVEPMSKIPPLSGTATVRLAPPGRVYWIEYGIRWAGRQDRLGVRDLDDPRIDPTGTAAYAVQGLRAGAALTERLDVAGGFENVTDELYRTHASGVDGPGRHVWIGVTWEGGL